MSGDLRLGSHHPILRGGVTVSFERSRVIEVKSRNLLCVFRLQPALTSIPDRVL